MTRTPVDRWQLPLQSLGQEVLIFEQLESTNSYATSLASAGATRGLSILAREQTAGRGQHGRTWTCERGVGVLLSVLLFPPAHLRRPVILAALAANAVCETILKITNIQAKIKWPNDVLIRGKKVCGILIEQSKGTVIGIGLNVNQSPESLHEQNLPFAASLRSTTGVSINCDDVTRTLMHQIDDEYTRLLEGDLSTLESCWKWRTGLLGKQVDVECHDAVYSGRLVEMAWDGVELEQGGRNLQLAPEAVKHITIATP